MSDAPPAYPYIPNSAPAVRRAMLDAIGVDSAQELYGSIPERLRSRACSTFPSRCARSTRCAAT